MSMNNSLESEDEAHTFKILITSDNHLGYMEKDPVRGNDSITTFEEILSIAREQKVDFILLGGDLFHENRPSRKILYQTMDLLRAYCFGAKPCPIEILSDASTNFAPSRFTLANYQDPNFRVSIPIFSIHGNHDDPSGDGNLCAMDLLSVAGFVNYFGKVKEVDDVSLNPIILKKGTTRLVLYGLGNIRDERLHRTFLQKRVRLVKPNPMNETPFNLMVFHQNRSKHGQTNYIPESFLPEFLDLVVWGHEHECLIDPTYSPQQDFYVSQPGSSIATSLSEGEAVPKYVGILRLKGRKFSIEKIPLKTVRPFLLEDICLLKASQLRPTDTQALQTFLTRKIEDLILQSQNDWKLKNGETSEQSSEKTPPLPLIRLKVDYSGGFVSFNVPRFGQPFVHRVANPKDLILFYRKRTANKTLNQPDSQISDTLAMALDEVTDGIRMQDLIRECLHRQELEIFPELPLGDAVQSFVDKDDKDAIKSFISESLNHYRKYLKSHPEAGDDQTMKEEIRKEKDVRAEKWSHMTSTTSIEPGAMTDAKETREEGHLSRSSSKNSILDKAPDPSVNLLAPSSLKYRRLPLSSTKTKSAPKRSLFDPLDVIREPELKEAPMVDDEWIFEENSDPNITPSLKTINPLFSPPPAKKPSLNLPANSPQQQIPFKMTVNEAASQPTDFSNILQRWRR